MGVAISAPLVYFSILVIAVCGIIYELIIAAVSSYLWGDSVLYFSMTIGLYMSAMGIGAFLSKFVKHRLFDAFILSESLVGLVGGSSALVLFWVYANSEWYEVGLIAITLLIGILVGVEIPLLIRILEHQSSLRQNVAHVLSYDYIGGLIGALAFPLLLLPSLGLIRTAIVLGISNLLVASINFLRHYRAIKFLALQSALAAGILGFLTLIFIQAPDLENALEQHLYRDKVIFSRQTPYQHLTLTQYHNDIRLFINGGLQFSSLDEYRYHESLVHVPMAAVPSAKHVLVLGGGDGMAVRELLKYPALQSIDLVDLDPAMTKLFQQEALLTQLNQNSLNHSKVRIYHQDAYKFVEQNQSFYDVIVVDLPDPSHTALAKLYSKGFYQILQKRLSLAGVIVTQSTSPFFAREAFWCIHQTIRESGLNVWAYQTEVPSFGNWGFQLASKRQLNPQTLNLPAQLKLQFLDSSVLRGLFVLPQDLLLKNQQIQANTLMQPILLQYYQRGWDGLR